MKVLEVIKRGLAWIVKKVRALFASKNKDQDSSKSVVERLSKENEELKKKVAYLEKTYSESKKESDDEISFQKKLHDSTKQLAKDKIDELKKDNEKIASKKERATKMIADLKKQIKENETKMDEYKKSTSSKRNYDAFYKEALGFITHVTTQVNKAYTLLPKIAEQAKNTSNDEHQRRRRIDDDSDDSKYSNTEIHELIPAMCSGQWSYLYKSLRYTWLPRIKNDNAYLSWKGDLGRAFEIMVKQSNDAIEYIEKTIKSLDSDKDKEAVQFFIRCINRNEGFLDMLRSSVSLANEILNVFTEQDVWITHNVHDSF